MYVLLLWTRYLRTRYLAMVCVVSVMLGVATLIVVNGVMSGFSTKLKERLQTLLRRGKVLAYLNRHAEAMGSYRGALELDPADGLSHYELGIELLAAKEFDAAGKEFGEAARLTPDRVGARFNYGTWLINQNRLDEAQREFEAVVRLEPSNIEAQKRLAALKAKAKCLILFILLKKERLISKLTLPSN